MFMTPTAVLFAWFRGLLSIAIIIGGAWLAVYWYNHLPQYERVAPYEDAHTERSAFRDEKRKEDNQEHDKQPSQLRQTDDSVELRKLTPTERITAWKPQLDWETAALCAAVLLLLLSSLGRWIHPAILLTKTGSPAPPPGPAETHRITTADGSQLHTEVRGPIYAPTVILTHGWSLSGREWDYLQSQWGGRLRTITWDLPGLGKSTEPQNSDFSLESMARALKSVVDTTTSGPVILVGHSIGGMITLTFCKLFPELLGTRISKLVLIHTSYTNPLKTMLFSGLFTALQKPLVEPLIYLQIALSPLVRLMNYLSYWNGTIHSSVLRNGYTWQVSRQKVGFVADFYPEDSPAVLARGCLGMLKYDATTTLNSISIPVLVVGGENDPVTLNEASEYIHRNVRGSQLKVLPGTKHFGLLEFDADTAKFVADFCSAKDA